MISGPTCPAQVSFMGYVLPSGPSPCHHDISRLTCTWLSHAQSTMPNKTPQLHAVAHFSEHLPESKTHDQELPGLPEFSNVSLPACHGLWTPADLHILAKTDASVLPSASVKTLGVHDYQFRSCLSTSGYTATPTAYRILCLRLARLVR